MSTSGPAPGTLEADIRAQAAAYTALADHAAGSWAPSIDRALRSGFGRVVLTGMGSSYFAALAAERWLDRRGVPARARLASELLHDGPPPAASDLVVAVSQSGGSIETVRVLHLAAEAGATTLVVTRDPGSPAAAAADSVMPLDVPPDHGVAVKTFGASLLALRSLADGLTGKPAGVTRGSVGSLALVPEEPARGIGSGLVVTAAVALARGRLGPVAREGALLINEVANLPGWAEDPGQFRHGIIELAGPEVLAILLVGNGPGASMQIGLAEELRRTRARVVAIVPAGLAGRLTDAGAQVIPVPEVARPVDALAHVICLQWLALGMAEARGVEPGRFRFAQEVVRSEAGAPEPVARADVESA